MEDTRRTFRPCIWAYVQRCGGLFLLPVFSLIIAVIEDDIAFYWMAAVLLVPLFITLATLLRYRVTVDDHALTRRSLWRGAKRIERMRIVKAHCIRERLGRERPVMLHIYLSERPEKVGMGVGLSSFSAKDREEIVYLMQATPVPTH